MRVKVDGKYGELIGLTITEREDTVAVVRMDGHGLMLTLYHPSKLSPSLQSEEEKQ